ncbi:MAG: hypothetical protein GDA46_06635 [Bdellovibrionales bacterium]|nr:hypothetical protein [Bdellovibrionales bacterium]
MNVIEISCPAKTFIVGEYAVLDGGSAIVLNTSPRFVFRIKKQSKAKFIDFHENSPAGQWIRKNPQDFQSVQIESVKNSLFQGGLGFSSAQFNTVYAYSFILRQGHIDHIKPQDVWKSYRNLCFEGFKPSGADITTQWIGGVGIFEQDPFHVESLTFYFPELECLVLSTGESFPTYDYLKNFQTSDVSQLKEISEWTVNAMKKKDKDQFISGINNYRKALIKKNYVTEKSKDILRRLEKIKALQAFKSCGAMGAETLVIFYNKQDDEEVREAVSFLKIIADTSQLTYGVEFHKLTKKTEVL